MTKVFAYHIAELGDPKEQPELMENLAEDRKLKIAKCMREAGRRQILGAGLLLKYVLELYGKNSAELTLGENGKPEIEGLCFNLSHSENWVICAVSDQPVGCDIERIKEAPLRIVERYFSETERKMFDGLSLQEQTNLFYRLWTMKESYLKMTGEGLQVPLNQVEIALGEIVQIRRKNQFEACFLKEYELSEYKVTVCAKEDRFDENIVFLH